MTIKVLGPGCMNCKTLESRTREALAQLSIPASLEKVEDMKLIASYRIMRTPGLVIDGTVVLSGQVPTVDKLKEILLAHQGVA